MNSSQMSLSRLAESRSPTASRRPWRGRGKITGHDLNTRRPTGTHQVRYARNSDTAARQTWKGRCQHILKNDILHGSTPRKGETEQLLVARDVRQEESRI